MARAIDNDGDLLQDEWENSHGLATNVYRAGELLGWWRMETNDTNWIEDFSGNGLTGWLWHAGATPFVTGLFDGAVALGPTSMVEFGSAAVALDPAGFTVSAWMVGSNLGDGARIVRWEDVASNSWELGVGPDGGARLVFSSADGPLLSLGIGPEPFLGDNSWHHLVGVHDAVATEAFLYVDGVLRASGTPNNWSPQVVGCLALGNGAAGGTAFDLDEVRFYDVPLGAEEIPLLPETYADADADGLANAAEFTRGTNPLNPDTDGDGCCDGDEVWYYNSDPLDPNSPFPPDYDADDDGINDDVEPFYGTDPYNPDSDGDGMPDGWEVARGLDPLLDDASADPDDDGLLNGQEHALGTNPGASDTDADGYTDGEEIDLGTDPLDGNSHPQPDSDGDGMPDGWETAHGLDPTIHNAWDDPDSDSLYNIEEYNHGTDPFDADSDDDGLDDWTEISNLFTWPNDADTDDDGMPDGWEVAHALDPLVWNSGDDADSDGLNNADEYGWDTDPNLADSDGDGFGDGVEVNTFGTDPADPGSCPDFDADDDGINDMDESIYNTDPSDWDSDDDGLSDGDEVWIVGTNPTIGDTDGDSYGDGDEVWNHGTNPLDGGSYPGSGGGGGGGTWEEGDDDADGLSNGDESAYGTSTSDPDSDDDWLNDWDEIYNFGTSPTIGDTDGDGYGDGDEVWNHGTNPLDGTSYPGSGGGGSGGTWEEGDDDGDGLSNGDESGCGTSPYDPDSDDDGLTDGDEVARGTSPTVQDTDGDGYGDGDEVWTHGTNPLDANSYPDPGGGGWESGDDDNDGLANGEEVSLGTNPFSADTDGDGLDDGNEVHTLYTWPTDADTDDDGMPDGWEVAHALDPLNWDEGSDIDNDGLSNGGEYAHGTDPGQSDSDGDGFSDGDEVFYWGTNPADPGSGPDFDADDDGINDMDESSYNTDPNDWDSDDDGLSDGEEVFLGSNPNDADTDDDTLPDGWEVSHGLDPNASDQDANSARDDLDDFDGDGLTNAEEYARGTDPCAWDTDGDWLGDGEEAYYYGTDPTTVHSDTDGIPDGWEIACGLNPLDPNDGGADPDGDGRSNFQEYQEGTDPLAYFDGETPTIAVLGGDGQSGAPEALLPEPLLVGVSNASGMLANAPMAFEIAAGGGLLSLTNDGSGLACRIDLRSDSSGRAQVWLRLGSDPWATNAVRVSAGPDNQPAEVFLLAYPQSPIPPEGLGLWLKADAGVATNAAGRVVWWADCSPEGNDADCAIHPQDRPMLLTNSVRGLPAVSFDGFECARVAGLNGLTGNFTLAWVTRPHRTDWNHKLFGAPIYAAGRFSFLVDPAGAAYVGTSFESRMAPGNPPNGIPNGTIASNQWQFFQYTFKDGTGYFYKNGRLIASKTQESCIPWECLSIGWTYDQWGFDADLAELIVYRNALSEADRQLLNTYLTLRFSSGDADWDGLSDEWEIAHGLDPNDADQDDNGRRDDLDDFDGDGLSNYSEFTGGTDPRDFYNGQKPTLFVVSGDNQIAPTNAFLPLPVIVGVSNTAGALANAPVAFSVWEGDGLLSLTNDGTGLTNSLVARTDAAGHAGVYLRYGTAAFQTNQVRVLAGSPTNQAQVELLAFLDDGDLDNDGMQDVWEQAIIDFDSEDGVASLQDVVPGGDFDQDGVTNGMECALAQGLVGYWPFEETTGETAIDRSGFGNHGTLSNGVARTSGTRGSAVRFDGADDCGVVSNAATLGPTNAVTLACWLNVQAVPGGYSSAVSKMNAYMLHLDHRSATTYGVDPLIWVGGFWGACPSTAAVELNYGEWHHVAAVYDGVTIQTYIDGQPAGSQERTGPIDSAFGALGLGWDNRYPIGGRVMAGMLDEVRVYNRSLSGGEIQALMADGSGPLPPEGLGLWLRADKGIRTTNEGDVVWWADASPARNDADCGIQQPAHRPFYATNAIEGLPAVHFLEGESNSAFVAGLAGLTGNFTLAWVTCPDTVTNWNQQMGPTNGWGSFAFHTDTNGAVYVGTDFESLIGPGTPTNGVPNRTVAANQWQFFLYTWADGQGSFYKNGKLRASKPQAACNAWDGFQIGSDAPDGFEGQLAELILYRAALSESNHLALTSYIASRYNPGDADWDGLPDDWELAFGLDPGDWDENDNGIRDDLDDFDGDMMLNGMELQTGNNPHNSDTDGDGTRDGQIRRLDAARIGSISPDGTDLTKVILHWEDRSNCETGFRIERQTSNGPWLTNIATAAPDQTCYTNTSISSMTGYRYRITTLTTNGDQAVSRPRLYQAPGLYQADVSQTVVTWWYTDQGGFSETTNFNESYPWTAFDGGEVAGWSFIFASLVFCDWHAYEEGDGGWQYWGIKTTGSYSIGNDPVYTQNLPGNPSWVHVRIQDPWFETNVLSVISAGSEGGFSGGDPPLFTDVYLSAQRPCNLGVARTGESPADQQQESAFEIYPDDAPGRVILSVSAPLPRDSGFWSFSATDTSKIRILTHNGTNWVPADLDTWTGESLCVAPSETAMPGDSLTVSLSCSGNGGGSSEDSVTFVFKVPAEFATPAGDPVAHPIAAPIGATETNIPDGANEFTFSTNTPGVLTLKLKVRMEGATNIPTAIIDRFRFETDPVGDSTMTWDPANPSGRPTATNDCLEAIVTFTGLPSHNAGFGPKTNRLYFSNVLITQAVHEVFFPKDTQTGQVANHPDPGQGTIPNWFYYWKDGGVCSMTPETIFNPGTGPDDPRLGQTNPTNGPAIELFPGAAYENQTNLFTHKFTHQERIGGRNAKGIHTVASVMRHESTHQLNYQFLQSVRGTNSGVNVDLDRDGIPASPIYSPPLPVYWGGAEGWVFETLTRTPQGQDVPDTYDVATVKRWPLYAQVGDDEIRAYVSEQTGPVIYYTNLDWANPGCQSWKKYGPEP